MAPTERDLGVCVDGQVEYESTVCPARRKGQLYSDIHQAGHS